jgi:hypothetical protein
MLSPSWILPISFLRQADFYPEILDLMENSPNESIRKQIELVWLDFMQAMHWVYKTKWDINESHKIPDWDLMNEGEKNYLEAYGNYLLRLLEIVIEVGSLQQSYAALFQGISSKFDDVLFFQKLCEEILIGHYNDAINNISFKEEIKDRYEEARDIIKCFENPYSAQESNKPFPNRPYFHSIHEIAIEIDRQDDEQVFKRKYNAYKKAYAHFVRSIKDNKEAKCTYDDENNEFAFNKKVAYRIHNSVRYI